MDWLSGAEKTKLIGTGRYEKIPALCKYTGILRFDDGTLLPTLADCHSFIDKHLIREGKFGQKGVLYAMI